MTLPGKFISGFSGWVVDTAGYVEFFVIAAALGVPAILLVGVLFWHNSPQPRPGSQTDAD
jgi:PAT family beta-lactamase induction signal transducer AmpG